MKSSITKGLMGVAMLGVASTGFAYDWATINGSACQPYTASQASSLRATTAGIENTSSTATIRVTCPIHRDASPSVFGGLQILVAIRNAYDDVNFSCSLYSRNTFGGNPNAFSVWSDSYIADGDHQLYFAVANNTLFNADDTYALDCRVPPKSKIYGIFGDEF